MISSNSAEMMNMMRPVQLFGSKRARFRIVSPLRPLPSWHLQYRVPSLPSQGSAVDLNADQTTGIDQKIFSAALLAA